ncbi:MAG: hypothetical protein M3Q06_01335, partial [Bacteroidota bacterium]|nr:hypothetical protein [Bacteroidota bacterium]
MKKALLWVLLAPGLPALLLSCDQNTGKPMVAGVKDSAVDQSAYRYGGFGSAAKWGEHIVTIAG